jgi:peptidoglycan/LPS O-acetylase OafA/YrhL
MAPNRLLPSWGDCTGGVRTDGVRPSGLTHNPALDGIRAVAVLAVIGVHTNVPHMWAGYLGVDVFFVLSGFLITSLLQAQAANGGIALRAFYLRRARRLYPALLTMLALYLAIFPWFVNGHHVRDVLIAAFYLSDYAMAFWHAPQIIGHTWSLSVEEHFYLLWPFVVLGLSRIRTRRFVVYILVAAYIAATWWRIWSDLYIGLIETFFRFDTRVSGLILGALLAYVPHLRHRLWALALPPLCFAVWWTAPGARPIPTIFAELASAAAILWCLSGSAKPLTWRPLTYLGTISYGIYLYHWPVAWVVRDLLGLPWQQELTVTILTAIPLAHYSHGYIESRFMRQPQLRSAKVSADAELDRAPIPPAADMALSVTEICATPLK